MKPHVWPIIGLIVVFVAACVPQTVPPEFRHEVSVQAKCEAFADGLSVLAEYRRQGLLSPGEINAINMVRPAVNRICQADPIPEERSYLLAVTQGLSILEQVIFMVLERTRA